ncbi:cytochrome P450 [Ahrensia sp. R2A130]|uniref:cytochrome P450 n=1 Tax=Ahrensia sp. R2A130 TaxID=744979 RepID=UPI0001E0F818|nr:cytochrome P450 [Ahrensia sp. R2A130]EFL91006.1 cytochrome P450 [Ahrensia sp. R2A130]
MTATKIDTSHPPVDVEPFRPKVPVPRPTPPNNFVHLRTLQVLPKLLSNPLEALSADAFTMPITYSAIFSNPIALVHEPAAIKYLFVERPDLLRADPVRQAVLKPPLREGLLTAEGATWRRSRKLIAPVFAPRHIDSFAIAMRERTEHYVATLHHRTDNTLLIADEMAALAYSVLSQTLFTGDLDDESEQVLADVAFFLKHLSQPDPLDFLNMSDRWPRLTKLRGQKALRRLRQGVRRTAQNRKQRIDQGAEVPDDFLTLLLNTTGDDDRGLSLDEVEDNIITFIAAGHETTARALAWTLYLLANDEDARQRCEAEIDALKTDDLDPHLWGDHLPFTTACFEESMRLFPPASMIGRQAVEDVDHNGLVINKDATVLVSPWALHRHETLWDDPAAFKPLRFLGEARKSIDRFAYLPFGMGQRVCIGQRFAMQEAQIALAILLRNFRFDYAGAEPPWPVMKITIQPHNAMPMKVTART